MSAALRIATNMFVSAVHAYVMRARTSSQGRGLARPRDRPPSRLPDCLLAAYLPAACLSAWHRTNWPIDRTLCTELSNTSMNPPSEWDAHAETNVSSYIALFAAFRRLRQYLMIEQYPNVRHAQCSDSCEMWWLNLSNRHIARCYSLYRIYMKLIIEL